MSARRLRSGQSSSLSSASVKRYKKAMDAVPQTLRPAIFWVCIAGEAASEWARRNAMVPQTGLQVLRFGLAELAHHYGLCKLAETAPTNP